MESGVFALRALAKPKLQLLLFPSSHLTCSSGKPMLSPSRCGLSQQSCLARSSTSEAGVARRVMEASRAIRKMTLCEKKKVLCRGVKRHPLSSQPAQLRRGGFAVDTLKSRFNFLTVEAWSPGLDLAQDFSLLPPLLRLAQKFRPASHIFSFWSVSIIDTPKYTPRPDFSNT